MDRTLIIDERVEDLSRAIVTEGHLYLKFSKKLSYLYYKRNIHYFCLKKTHYSKVKYCFGWLIEIHFNIKVDSLLLVIVLKGMAFTDAMGCWGSIIYTTINFVPCEEIRDLFRISSSPGITNTRRMLTSSINYFEGSVQGEAGTEFKNY